MADARSLNLKPLLLAGGKSSRMGTPKHLLELPDGRPLYAKLVQLLYQACPGSSRVYVSVGENSTMDTPLRNGILRVSVTGGTDAADPHDIQLELVKDGPPSPSSVHAEGPAAGLVAAHAADPEATWLVTACDFPLLTADALHYLRSSYVPPVTCFRNFEGFNEPLLAIWGPEALRHLAENARQGRLSPNDAIRDLGGKSVRPTSNLPGSSVSTADMWLWNVNTEAEWERARQLLEKEREEPGELQGGCLKSKTSL